MQKIDKKAQVGSLQTFILSIAGVTIILAVTFILLAELKSSTTDTNATSAINTITNKLATIPTWVGILIVVAMAFLVMAYFTSRGR